MYKRLNNYLDRRPGIHLLILFVIFAVGDIYINISRQRPIWYDLQGTIILGLYFLLAYGLYSAKLKTRRQAVVGFGVIFSCLMITSWLDKSIVDYTSIIVVAGVALICTLFLMVIVWSLERNAERSK